MIFEQITLLLGDRELLISAEDKPCSTKAGYPLRYTVIALAPLLFLL